MKFTRLSSLLTGALVALALSATVRAVPVVLDFTTAGVGQYAPASAYNNDIEVTDAANALVNWYNGGANANTVLTDATFLLQASGLATPLPTPVVFGVKDDSAPFDSFWADAYQYVLGKYGNTAYLFYIGNLGHVEYALPSTLGGNGLSHQVLFNATTQRVPDTTGTLLLLVAGIGALVACRSRKG